MLIRFKNKFKTLVDDVKVLTKRHIFAAKVPLLEEHEIVGQDGEDIVFDLLVNRVNYIKQGIIIESGTKVYEKDFIVVDRGNIFIIEVKNWKGFITYNSINDEWMKHKQDQYTNDVYEKTFKNPLKNTLKFCNHLQKDLAKKVDSFQFVSFIPIIVFVSEECQLDESVRKLNPGIIYIYELLDYMKRKKKQVLSDEQMSLLYSLKTWDVIIGRNGSKKSGIIEDVSLNLLNNNKDSISLLCSQICLIERSNTHLMYDEFFVQFIDGQQKIFLNKVSKIHLRVPNINNTKQTFDLKEVQKIIFGDKY